MLFGSSTIPIAYSTFTKTVSEFITLIRVQLCFFMRLNSSSFFCYGKPLVA